MSRRPRIFGVTCPRAYERSNPTSLFINNNWAPRTPIRPRYRSWGGKQRREGDVSTLFTFYLNSDVATGNLGSNGTRRSPRILPNDAEESTCCPFPGKCGSRGGERANPYPRNSFYTCSATNTWSLHPLPRLRGALHGFVSPAERRRPKEPRGNDGCRTGRRHDRNHGGCGCEARGVRPLGHR